MESESVDLSRLVFAAEALIALTLASVLAFTRWRHQRQVRDLERRAARYLRAGQLAQAEVEVMRWIDAEPRSWEAQAILGDLWLLGQQDERADAAYQRSQQLYMRQRRVLEPTPTTISIAGTLLVFIVTAVTVGPPHITAAEEEAAGQLTEPVVAALFLPPTFPPATRVPNLIEFTPSEDEPTRTPTPVRPTATPTPFLQLAVLPRGDPPSSIGFTRNPAEFQRVTRFPADSDVWIWIDTGGAPDGDVVVELRSLRSSAIRPIAEYHVERPPGGLALVRLMTGVRDRLVAGDYEVTIRVQEEAWQTAEIAIEPSLPVGSAPFPPTAIPSLTPAS